MISEAPCQFFQNKESRLIKLIVCFPLIRPELHRKRRCLATIRGTHMHKGLHYFGSQELGRGYTDSEVIGTRV
jgi:hypothetical protein